MAPCIVPKSILALEEVVQISSRYPELQKLVALAIRQLHYKDNGKDDNLLSILKSLADDRKKYGDGTKG